jgi:hypothetical protein
MVSYLGGFFPENLHHVVQPISPAIGTYNVRSCVEMKRQSSSLLDLTHGYMHV